MVTINLGIEFDPDISQLIDRLEESDKKTFDNVDNALRISALELNRDLKNANPAKTGYSRRGWDAPKKTGRTSWVVSNKVNYVSYIKYGVTKPSRYVAAPKGVTINPGKSFENVIEETFDVIIDKLEEKMNEILSEYLL